MPKQQEFLERLMLIFTPPADSECCLSGRKTDSCEVIPGEAKMPA
jgi:hypothetical protein